MKLKRHIVTAVLSNEPGTEPKQRIIKLRKKTIQVLNSPDRTQPFQARAQSV
jgi:hypothetical protein